MSNSKQTALSKVPEVTLVFLDHQDCRHGARHDIDGLCRPLARYRLRWCAQAAFCPVAIWKSAFTVGGKVDNNAVEFLIHALRRKLGSEIIKNVRGAGWMVSKDA